MVAGEPLDLLDEKEVGRLGDGHREHAPHPEQRQHVVFLEELTGQHLDDLRIGDLGRLGHEGQAIVLGEHLHDLPFTHEVELNEKLAKELLVALL